MSFRFRNWKIFLAGLAGGILYAYALWYLDHAATEKGTLLTLIHHILDWFIPVGLGVTIATGISLFIEQKHLNRNLSTENAQLRSRLLTHTFASYILHEIGNPLHNLSAVLENTSRRLPGDESEIIERNLNRISKITGQLKQMSLISGDIDLDETVDFEPWIGAFVESRTMHELRKSGIRYEQRVNPVRVRMHPLLLEQCFTLLFDNAIRSARTADTRALISLHCRISEARTGCAEIILKNTGSLFPVEVVEASGRYMTRSSQGSGLGLVLVRDTLKNVGGEFSVSNEKGQAKVILYIPSEVSGENRIRRR